MTATTHPFCDHFVKISHACFAAYIGRIHRMTE
ncbi:hypothetical protein ACVWXO_005011 [Bradyrhizobium sp. LM2.7]